MVMDDTDSTALRAEEMNPPRDSRYIGLNRAQRRKAQASERKAAKHGRI